ncbi:MAG: DUF3014 domain-containing protein [Gammaproteobacteria bacterium]|nr:DUF3014 domain-containing protein [Gammaproteobacteria bacterium]MBU2435738.1 DUF3014 domain-containing protein [Gammaproteobacteria bacterium]MBU2449481.1 DUF3014 domain-containing protein [Gammaproteobacteria bacterium]
MGKKLILVLGIVVAAGLGVVFWLYQPEAPEPEQVAVAPPPPPPPAAVTPPPPPLELHPLPPVEASATLEPLPDIEQSDSRYRQALAGLFSDKLVNRFFHSEHMIRRFVATIDNLPRHEPLDKMMPVKPVGGAFLVERQAAGLIIAPANDQRYVGYLKLMTMVEPRRLVDVYVRFYPLFQRAYRDLGYPEGFFNDRLIEAIDNLLETPDVAPPIALEQPKVLYTYADKSLEARSSGQRIMLRLGADNRAKATQMLTAIRQELLSRSPSGE